jgi:hypothetical protein
MGWYSASPWWARKTSSITGVSSMAGSNTAVGPSMPRSGKV